MNYKVGDEVVCIDAQTNVGWRIPLSAGDKLIVNHLCKKCVSFVGRESGSINGLCLRCNSSNGYLHYQPWRFIKLDKLTESSTEQLTEKV